MAFSAFKMIWLPTFVRNEMSIRNVRNAQSDETRNGKEFFMMQSVLHTR